LVGGQRGVRRVAGQAAASVRVVREAIEVEVAAMVPLFRGQKSRLHSDNGLHGDIGVNGVGERQQTPTTAETSGKREAT